MTSTRAPKLYLNQRQADEMLKAYPSLEKQNVIVVLKPIPPSNCPTRIMDGRNELRCWFLEGHEGECK